MNTKIDKLFIAFDSYLSGIHNANREGMLDKAKRLEYVIMIILNKCNNWHLTNFHQPNFPAIDLYDYSKRISVQIKSVNINEADISGYLNIIEKNKNNFQELNNMEQRYYFVPYFNEKLRNTAKKAGVDMLSAVDIKNLMIANSDNLNYFLDIFNFYEEFDKNNGCYFFKSVMNDKYLFEFISESIKLTSTIPELNSYIKYLDTGNLYIEADAGRGKTVLGYLIGKHFIKNKWDVLYFDINEFNKKNSFFSNLGKVIFSSTLIVVDNCHINLDHIENFEKIANNVENVKLLFLSRFFNNINSIKYEPNANTISEILLQNHIELSMKVKNNIVKIVGENNSNLRLLSIILKSPIYNSSKNRIDLYKGFYKTYTTSIKSRSECERVLTKLDSVALSSIDERVYFSFDEIKEIGLDKLYDSGLLTRKEGKLAFPHSQDAIAYLIGKYGDNFINEVIKPFFEKCKNTPTDYKLLHLFNSLVFNYVDSHKTNNGKELNKKISVFFKEWKNWVVSNSIDSNIFFSTDLINLNSYYFFCKVFDVLNEDEIISHFKDFISVHRNLFIKAPFYLNHLIVISTVLVGDRYKFVEMLNLSDSELEHLDSTSSNKLQRIRWLVNKKGNHIINRNENLNSITTITNEYINKNIGCTEINNKNVFVFKIKNNEKIEFNNISISKLAYKLQILNDTNYRSPLFVKKANDFFTNNITQITVKSKISSISNFVNQIKRSNYREYEKVIANKELKSLINSYFKNNFSTESIFVFDGFFHSNIDYLTKIYSEWIFNVAESSLKEYLVIKKERIISHKLLITDLDFYNLITKHFI